MPATSEKQRRLFGAELQRALRGKRTKTKLPVHKLKEFTRK